MCNIGLLLINVRLEYNRNKYVLSDRFYQVSNNYYVMRYYLARGANVAKSRLLLNAVVTEDRESFKSSKKGKCFDVYAPIYWRQSRLNKVKRYARELVYYRNIKHSF